MLQLKEVTRLFRHWLVRFYFRRVQVFGTENIPENGAVLLSCVHRNGAVDGVVMESVLHNPVGIAGNNLTGSAYMRMFLGESVAIHRRPSTPAENRENLRQFKKVASTALDGRPVVMFPEGTSKLGPNLLPIKRGLAYLARLTLKEGRDIPVSIVPVGLHYTRGFEFRSDVEISYGTPISISKDNVQNLDELTARIADAMGDVAVIFPDAEEQRRGELFADTVCTLNDAHSHRSACLAYAARELPQKLCDSFNETVKGHDRHSLPPVFPKHGQALGWLECILLSPLILLFFMANLLPLAGGYAAAHIMADDDNVITLWRILTGVPLWAVQMITYLAIALIVPDYAAALTIPYIAVTCLGILGYRRWKSALAGVMNLWSNQRKSIEETDRLIREWADVHTE